MSDDTRHSRRKEAEFVTDPRERAEREAQNGLRQFDVMRNMIRDALAAGTFSLKISSLLTLNRSALEGLNRFAGSFRSHDMEIIGSRHVPPPFRDVPEHVEEMIETVNTQPTASAIHLSAYVMWRLNWIHPFDDGNGRTSRAASYYVLCARLGYELPGTKTIPEIISENKAPYYRALELADEACAAGRTDVIALEGILRSALAGQLLTISSLG